jgi:hypothetical protein
VGPDGAGPERWATLAGLGVGSKPHEFLPRMTRPQPTEPYAPEDVARQALRRLTEAGITEWAGSDTWRPVRRAARRAG